MCFLCFYIYPCRVAINWFRKSTHCLIFLNGVFWVYWLPQYSWCFKHWSLVSLLAPLLIPYCRPRVILYAAPGNTACPRSGPSVSSPVTTIREGAAEIHQDGLRLKPVTREKARTGLGGQREGQSANQLQSIKRETSFSDYLCSVLVESPGHLSQALFSCYLDMAYLYWYTGIFLVQEILFFYHFDTKPGLT